MKVKCPKCGHEFKVEGVLVKFPAIKPDMSGSSIPDMSGSSIVPSETEMGYAPSLKDILYCGPYKKAVLSCGHIFHYEFSQFHKGQKIPCFKCGKDVKVVKLIDTVTGKEYDRL